MDRFRYRHIIQIAILLALAGITAVLFFPVKEVIELRMEEFKEDTVERIETALGRRISYEKLSPSLFRHLKIEGLTVHADGRDGPALVEVNRIRVYYRIFKLLSKNPADALYEIRIENTAFSVDVERDTEIIAFLENFLDRAREAGGSTALPDITVSGRKIDITVLGKDFDFSSSDIFFSFRARQTDYQVSGRGSVDVSFEEKTAGFSAVSSSLNLSGRIGADLSWADMNAGIKRFSSNLIDLRDQQFYINLNNDTVTVRKTQDKAPIDLTLTLDILEEAVSIAVRTEDFRPDTLLEVNQDAAFLAPWMGTLITGSMEGTYRFQTGQITYSADLEVQVDSPASPLPFDAVIRAAGDLERADIDLLRITSSRGSIAFSGTLDIPTLLPDGILRFQSLPFLDGNTADGTLVVRRETDRVRFTGSSIILGDTALEKFELIVRPLEEAVRFTSDIRLKGFRENRITSDGTFQYGPEPLLEVNLQVSDTSASALAETLLSFETYDRLPAAVRELVVDSQLFLTTDLENTAFLLPNFLLYQEGNSENRLTFNAAGNQNGLEVSDLGLRWNKYTLEGGLTAVLETGNVIEAQTEFSLNGVPYSLSGLIRGTEEIVIHGSYETVFTMTAEEDRYSFRLQTGTVPVPINGRRGRAVLDIYGYYEAADSYQIFFDNCRISKFTAGPLQQADITVSLSADANSVMVHKLDYKDTYSRVEGMGKFTYTLSSPFAAEGWLHLQAPDEGEQYISVFDFAGGSVNGSVRVREIPLERFFRGRNIRGLVDGLIQFSGPVKSPDFELYVKTEEAFLNNDPIDLELSGTLTKEKLAVSALDLRFLGNRILLDQGSFDFSKGQFVLQGEYSGTFQNEVLRAGLRLSGETKKREDRSKFAQILEGDLNGTGRILNPNLGTRELQPWTVDFEKTGDSIQVFGGPENALNAKFKTTGSFEVKLSAPLPVSLYAKGSVRAGEIEAELKHINLDLDALNTLLIIPYFHIIEGQGFGDLTITGPINDPDFYGTLQLLEAVAQNPLVPEDLGPFSTQLVFDGKIFSVQDVAINAGSGKMRVNADFIMDHWVPRQYNIRITTQEGRALPMTGNFAGVVVDGYALGNIDIAGDFSGVDVTGALRIVDAGVTLGDREEAPQENTAFTFRVDMELTTGRKVDFRWPAGNFPILRTSAETDQVVRIFYNSGSGEYEVKGKVNIRGGQIFYFSRYFYLTEGAITFNETTGRFDPRLTVRADIRDVTPAGEDVTISLIVDNNPLSQFSPRFESNPVLPNTEILALLGQNVITQLGGEEIRLSSALALTGGIVLNQFGFFRSFEEAVKDIFRLDLFSIRTQVLENLLVESIFGPEAQEGTTVNTLSRYLDNTTLFLGKYLSDDIFIEAMVGLRVKNLNTDADYMNEEFVVDTEVSLEWKTPLALLEFSFMPNMTDLFGKPPIFSLSLSWGFSF